MGYTTEFEGEIHVTPPLNEHEVQFLRDFAGSRRMKRTNGPLYAVPGDNHGQGGDDVIDFNNPPVGQPGLWCQWEPSDDGTTISWDGGEKFYDSPEWMKYVVTLYTPEGREFVQAHEQEHPALKHFTFDHVFNGVIEAQGEESGDRWALLVTDNKVAVQEYRTTIYGEPRPI